MRIAGITLFILGLASLVGGVVFLAVAIISNNEKAEEERRVALEAIVKIEPELEGYNPEDLKVVDDKYVEYEDGHLLRLSDSSVKLLQDNKNSSRVIVGLILIMLGGITSGNSVKIINDSQE